MKKRLISLIVAAVMLFSMLCPAAYADDGTVSFDTCSHEWETPIRSGYSYTIPNTDVSFGVKVEQCKKCKWYKHVASIIIAEYTYYSVIASHRIRQNLYELAASSSNQHEGRLNLY